MRDTVWAGACLACFMVGVFAPEAPKPEAPNLPTATLTFTDTASMSEFLSHRNYGVGTEIKVYPGDSTGQSTLSVVPVSSDNILDQLRREERLAMPTLPMPIIPTQGATINSSPYGMGKDEFGAFIEERVRKAMENPAANPNCRDMLIINGEMFCHSIPEK
jgi:hypothetical protein